MAQTRTEVICESLQYGCCPGKPGLPVNSESTIHGLPELRSFASHERGRGGPYTEAHTEEARGLVTHPVRLQQV